MMNDATCKTCPWCDYEDEDDGTSWCLCRKYAPEAAGRVHKPAFWPVVDEHTDWCGSHPDRQPHVECVPGVIKERPAPLTEADVLRIVASMAAR